MYTESTLEEIPQDKISDAFGIIQKCAVDLKEKGFSHWAEYYADLGTFQRQISEKEGKVYVRYINGVPAATVTLSQIPPHYYTNPEMPELIDGADNFIQFFTPVDPEDSAMYVSALGVLPEFQGRKLGRKIMEQVEEIARNQGIKAIRFDTRAEFIPAVKLYESLGYREVHVDRIADGESYNYYEKLLD